VNGRLVNTVFASAIALGLITGCGTCRRPEEQGIREQRAPGAGKKTSGSSFRAGS